MKTFALAALAAVGLAFTAGTADAQFRARSGYAYSYPSYSYSAPSAIYSYPSYSYSSYTPTHVSGIVTSNYSPYSSTVVTPAGYSTYSPVYGSGYTYATPYYSGVYVAPAVGVYRGRGWRW